MKALKLGTHTLRTYQVLKKSSIHTSDIFQKLIQIITGWMIKRHRRKFLIKDFRKLGHERVSSAT